MSEILCRWLNQELRLSKAVEPKTFAKDFSSGYLIGEILHKYQLQNDFSLFMKKDTSISKLNNFTRLEPTLQLLGISFDINKAQDLMQEKQGVATRLLYQLYISLERKKRAEISGTMMEIMQPAASADLHKKAHDIYSDRLHQVVKRDAELKLQKISQHYEEKCQQSPERSVMTHPIQQKRQLKVQDQKQMKNIEKLQISRQKYSGIMPCNQATIVQVPKPPPYTSQLLLKKRQKQQQSREQQAQMVQTEIAQFETKRKKLATSGFVSSLSGRPSPGDFLLCGTNQASVVPKTKLTLQSNSKYIQEIRQRREENAMAREQMEKRRDKFLVEQLRAHEVQEEAQRDEQLVKRLTRQTQQEQRLVSQLLQIRMQKEVIRENRLFREQQYQERREKDFQEALEREAALAQQHKLDRAEEIKQELEFLSRAAAERAQSRYKKHLKSCRDIVEQIVDLATKVGEYRLLTANLIPEKLMKEWKDLLLSGLPLYEPIQGQQPGFQFSTPLDPVELKKQEILNNQDYDEYTNMVGEWTWPKDEEGESKLPPTNNNVLGHVVVRLRRIVCPTITEPPPPPFPHFTFKACAMGKFCSGKTTCLAKISEVYGICVLSADTLIEEALTAYRNGEEVSQVTEQQGEKDTEQLLVSSTSLKSDVSTQEESGERNVKRSNRAIQGEAAEKELKEGNPIPNELVVDIIVEAIRHLPAESGWILDGFPVDITQAYLLEKALGGSVDVGNGVESSRVSLATDPNPPKPLSPSKPVLDLALLLDVPDESVIRRAFSHTDDASDTTTDKDLHLAQIQHRITAFQDTWLKLEKWFGEKQNILVRVDANVAEEELYKRVDAVLQQIFMQKQEALSSGSAEDVSDTGKALDSFSSATPVEDKPPALTESTSSPRKEKVHSANSLSKSNTNSPRVSSKDSQGGSKNQTDSAASVPGSPSWVYVDEPLPRDVSEYLCAHWDEVCDSYIDNIKTVMQQLRSQRIVIIHHLFNIREEFKHYLGRPDLKQELMCQWQKDFNGIPDDMREDDDTKAELHLRLDELREQLWDISDKRKEQDEQERASLMSKWLDDHIAILINHHSTLMQVELNRFQETLCLLRVYYLSMYTKLPEPPSNFACISLLDVTELKDQDESSTQPAETSVFSQEDDGEEQRKIKYVPLLPRTPDSGGVSKTKGQDETEPVQPFSHEKLITDYEEALKTINNLVSAEAYHGEMKKLKERPQQTEGERAGTVSPTTASSPALIEDKPPEKTHHQELINKIHKEYAAALSHEENAAKVRIALVKSHGLVMVQTLQSRAEQAFSSMQKWLEEHYVAEMKSIDQLSEVVRHHIEACAKLQNELVLESTEFYLNGDCNMVASPPPPSRPPPLEKPSRSTPTITQLESLYRQLCNIAPTGLLSTFEFSIFLRDITSVNIGKNTLPEPWINTNGTQLMEIVSLLMDEYELVDWRRFLLSAALPWPFPSLTQLLDVLQRFKAADTGDTGYINKEQYLQTELWFSTESVQDVPEDPTEPLPYDRLSNLHKFFFQLFADHSVSPPRLDYVFMLQYFAADPNPRQGFIRTLSVALGQHLKHSSPGRLVKSLPRIEEAAELSTSELNEEREEDGTACASNSLLMDQEVSISALLDVICHKVTKIKDVYHLPPGCMSQEEQTQHLVHIFKELGFKPDSCVPFSVLSVHPFIQSRMESSTQYQLINIHKVLLAHQAEEETSNSTVS